MLHKIERTNNILPLTDYHLFFCVPIKKNVPSPPNVLTSFHFPFFVSTCGYAEQLFLHNVQLGLTKKLLIVFFLFFLSEVFFTFSFDWFRFVFMWLLTFLAGQQQEQ